MDDFVPRRGWSNPHLQTVRSRIRPIKVQLPPSDEVVVNLPDGSGDRLAVQVHEANPSQPLVIIVHGLGGTAESDYVRFTTAGLLAAGFPVARVDLRGAGMSGEVSAGSYHGGRTEDLRAVVDTLGRRSAVVGFSLGANATIKLLGEHSPAVVAGVAVSAPLDLAVGAEHLHHIAGGWYERFLLRRLRAESLRPAARYTPEERAAILSAKSIVDFDNAITAPRNGWRDAAEYYRVNSAIRYLDSVQQPLLVIHAKDDPMIPLGPYESVDWNAFPAVRLVLTEHGGHVGFHGRDDAPWYVGAIVEFLRSSVSPDPDAGGRSSNAGRPGR
ncbi:MAG: alpha/beta fold hydrolase [Actinobacteria bacterium]|nr:alpha/beta fold hydrolase [Actinomycetota bacterium]